jgi:outer membrane immunogenic protein
MKSILIGGVALAALSTAAFAVEMTPAPDSVPPPAEVAPHNWTGPYGRWSALPAPDSLLSGTATPNAQFGFNYQKGQFVFGIEGDMARRGGTDFTNLLGAHGLDYQNEQGWIGTLRPRAGLAVDNWMFYGTGGAAYSAGNAIPFISGSSPGRSGWAVGGGLEYTNDKQWSLGLEYLYADFGKSSQSQPGAAPAEDRSQMFRGRLNYRFGW